MKVLMTADTVGGVFTYAAELAPALRAEGAEVVLATMGAPLRDDQRAALGDVEVHESAFRLEWMDDPWADVAAAGEWLLALEARERPDVVHLNGYAHAALGWRAPCVVVAHSCVCSWWRAVLGEEAPAGWDRYRDEVARGLRAADAVVAVSAALLDEVRELYGVGGSVVHNGSAHPASSPAKGPLVLGAGRLWDAGKNLAALDAAAEGLAWPVVVAGDLGAAAPAHASAAGHLPAGALAALRRRAAVFAAPARYEPFGLAILEAARDRCALVLGDIASLREVWGDAALYVDPDDDRALHGALAELARDAGLRERLAAAAQRRSARYTVQAAARAYGERYHRVAAGVPA
jgi:glycogen synthase